MISRYGQIAQLVPLIEPKNITTSATYSAWVNAGGAHRVTFMVFFGSLTAASIDQAVTVTVKAASTAATTLAVAIAFRYRLSGAVGADTFGAVTAATAAAGVAITPTGGAAPMGTNKILLIDVDPADIRNGPVSLLGKYAAVLLTPDAGATATNVAVLAELEPRYIQTTQVSSC
jgi:hypothetical protein